MTKSQIAIYERRSFTSGVLEQWTRNKAGAWFHRTWLKHTRSFTAWKRAPAHWKFTLEGNRLLAQDTSHPSAPIYVANIKPGATSKVPPGR